MSSPAPIPRGDPPAGEIADHASGAISDPGPGHFIDLDTRAAKAADRGGPWNRALVRATVPLSVYSRGENGLVGRLRADLIGSLRIVTIGADAQTVVRSPDPAHTPGRVDFYKFILHLRGRGRVSQDDRVAELGERAFVLCDTSRRYALDLYGPYLHQVLMIPRDVISVPGEAMATLTATPLPVERGAARVLARLLRDLRDDIGELSPRNRLTIAETLIELSEAVVQERLGSSLSAAESGVFAEVLAFVEHHLAEPSLTPQVIASAHFMSLRSLQVLFQSREQSPSGWIRKRRLENSRRDLIRFRADQQSIAVIAARWGFPDSGTFTRAFKKAFGAPPQEYRKAHSLAREDPAGPRTAPDVLPGARHRPGGPIT